MSRELIDNIKNQIDIVDIIRKTVNLTPSSNDIWSGSVGTVGKSGKSLKVDRRQQTYYDFKNGMGGDVFNWIAQNNNLNCKNDFTEILNIASEISGIPLNNTFDVEKAKQKREIHELHTEIAKLYNSNLTDELYDNIYNKWGIERETVDRLQIGLAPTLENNKSYLEQRFDKDNLIESGLVLKFGNNIVDFFNGRLVFPYWKNGKVVYFIARAIDGITPKNKYETYPAKNGEESTYIKYKKLLTPENHNYISDFIGNNYFYGEDSIKYGNNIIITEGITDCIMAIQSGFSCISPVTVQFREKDNDRLFTTLKNVKTVYICNDNEDNQAGGKGALKTGEYLENKGLDIRIVELPKPDEIDKIDVAEYIKNNGIEDFKTLVNERSQYIFEYKLKQVGISSNPVEKVQDALNFCKNNLKALDETLRYTFITNVVKEHFSLKTDEAKKIATDVKKHIEELNKQNMVTDEENDEGENTQTDEGFINQEDKIKADLEAIDILTNGNPMKYICDTVKDMHIGDERAIEGINLAITNQSCLNTQGIQIKLSGDSGGGKSHCVKSCIHCVRDKHIIESSLSAKAAYYMDLQPSTILFSDDTDISEDMETLIKRSTTNYQDYTTHTTVKDGSSMTLTIPPRILWLITSVEDEVSDQLLNRQLIFNVDTSTEQKGRIFEMQKKEALEGEIKTLQVTHEVLVCREMWDIIKSRAFKVRIPFADDIEVMDKSNSRNFPMFLDMLKGYTVINHLQRETDTDGFILAHKDDFYAAKSLFESQTESVLTKLNEKERRIIQAIGQKGSGGADINAISKMTEISYQTVRNTIKGRNNKPGGLLEKVNGLRHVKGSESESVRDDSVTITTTKNKERYILDGFNGWDIFDNGFVYLKSDS